jgi:chemotaxis protein MotB
VIEGHTDSDPIKKQAVTPAIKTNWELSSRRATGVLRFFEEDGLNSREYNIVAMGLGDSVPVADNLTEEGKAMNRRIVIRIEPDLEAIKSTLSQH